VESFAERFAVDVRRITTVLTFALCALVTVTLAAFAPGCTAPAPATPRAPTAGASHFTLMTFNVHRDRSSDASTIEAIGAPDVDIVCLQEVTAAWEASIRKRWSERYPHMIFATKENAGGLAVLSRYPLEDRGVIPLPDDLHPGWLVHVETPAGRIQVVEVHLRSLFNGARDWVSNYFATSGDHLMHARLFMDRATPELPTIVAGDFNESPDGDAVRMLEARGYVNMLPMFKPGQYTWYGKSIGYDMTIDHVMIDTSFEPLAARVERHGKSDHLPVVAHFELRAPPPDTATDPDQN
jgi:endonuclease/exonuclease/phosphatase family metal-dependent hydrolase